MRTKTLMFLITYKCNLRCSYCYEPKVTCNRINKTALQRLVLSQVESLPEEYDSFEIHFMGGEPLLEFPLIREISEWLWSQSFKKILTMIYAPTNGTLLTAEIRNWASSNKDRFCLGLSFDGDSSMQNVNRSKSASKVDLKFFSSTWPKQSVKMTVSPSTVNSLADGVKYLHNNGFISVVTDLAMGKEIGWEAQHLKTLSNQLDELSKFYVQERTNCHMSMLDIDIFGLEMPQDNTQKSCSCGEDLSCIDLNGEEYACHLFSPVALPIDRAKESQSIEFDNYHILQSKVCQKCVLNCLCNHCYGMNYICTGDVTKADPFHCAAFKIMFTANCRHQLRIAKQDNDKVAFERIRKFINLIA